MMAVSKPVANPMLAAAEVDDETPIDDAADHPDDGGPSNSDNKPPVALPDWLRRVGDLLSTPSGEPTALYKALMIPLVCGPLGFPLGAFAPIYPNVLVAIADDDMGGAIGAAGMSVATLLEGFFSLRTLRLATRHGGSLQQLGVGTALIPQSSHDSLVLWGRLIVANGATFLLGVVVLLLGLAVATHVPILPLVLFALWLVPWIIVLLSSNTLKIGRAC